MSRAPPFPTTSSRSRQPTNYANGYYDQNGSQQQQQQLGTQTVLPLSVQRPHSQAESFASSTGSNIRGPGPARPMRSELRTRQLSQTSTSSQQRGDRSDRELGTSRSMGSGLRDRDRSNRDQPQTQYAPSSSYGGERSQYSRGPSLDEDPYGGYDDAATPDQSYEQQRTPVVAPVVSKALDAFTRSAVRRNTTTDDEGREAERVRERERERERLQRIQARQNSRMVSTRRARTGDIDAILDQIQDEWSFVAEPDFNPVNLALELLDDTSVGRGRDIESFRRTKTLLGDSLRGTINQHYQNFAASLPHHSSLHNSLTKVQAEVMDARLRLQETRDALGTKRADLVQLWSRGQAVEEMTRLLDEVEHLKAIPDTLESMISEKRLLQASILLVRSLKLINKGELMEIGALADLRSYLTGQETALREILIEELQNHLYLKAFWCDSRWSCYVPGQQRLPNPDQDEELARSQRSQAAADAHRPLKLTRYLNDLTLRPSNENPYDLAEDTDLTKAISPGMSVLPSSISLNNVVSSGQAPSLSQNPESNSFEYIETLLEALSVLGKLGSGLDTIAQRLPVEIYSMIDSTIDEVRERSEFNKRASVSPMTFASNSRLSSMYVLVPNLQPLSGGAAGTLRLAALEAHSGRSDREPLNDLFWTLYSKLDAVLQALRVVYEVSNRIGSRRDFKDSSGAKPGALFPIMEIWYPIQNEIRSLLNDYLTDVERGATSGRHPVASINEALREGRVMRDKSRTVFRVSHADGKSSVKTLKKHEDELTRVLRESVPGLVGGGTDAVVLAPLSSIGTEDRYAGIGSHSRLIKPDAFHVTVLFQPTLSFLQRVEQVMPHGMSEAARAATTFLDDFVLKVYLPQLEERVSTLFQLAVGGADAFQEDASSATFSPKPLVKASTQLLALVNSLCVMHQSTPFHRENYSRLILDIIIRFYQKCYDRFVELVALPSDGMRSAETRISVSARWAQKGEVTACLSALFGTSSTDETSRRRLCRQETRVEMNFLTQDTINSGDLIPAMKNISALGTLYQSLSWLIKQLHALRTVTVDGPTSPTEVDHLSPTSDTPFSPVITSDLPAPSDRLELPLTKAMSLRYDALLKTYEQLAELVIHTIRVEIRCRIVHFLNRSMRQGQYQLEHEAGEPDPNIIDLNADLAAFEDCTNLSLPDEEIRFIFEGLGTLMEHLLIANSKYIRFVNENGIKKIVRNILALQQNLKTLSGTLDDTDFVKARRYFELFMLTPEQMLASVRKQAQFSFDEYKSMLYLQCGVDQTIGDSDVSDNKVNMYLIELHGLAVDDWDDTAE